MRAYMVFNPAHFHQKEAITALACGMIKHGVEVEVAHDWGGLSPADDIIVSWGDRHKHRDRPRLCLEAGYINGPQKHYVDSRLESISMSWNGLHGYGDDVMESPSDRWEALNLDLEPWRVDGEYALLLEQVPGDACAPSRGDWAGVIQAVNRRWSNYRRRPHPLVGHARQLKNDLEHAALAITWSSTAAVEAVIAGVPTITLDRGSIARPVTSHSLYDPLYTSDREQWAYNLAYRQWSRAELASGQAWEYQQACSLINE